MATMTTYLPLDGPNDVLWLAGPATVADADTYSFVNPYNGNTVVVTGKDFVFDENKDPIGGTYTTIQMYTDASLATLVATVTDLNSALATFSGNYIDDLAAAGVIADTPAGDFGTDTFVFTSGVGSDAATSDDTLDFAAFNLSAVDAGYDVSFNVLIDVLNSQGHVPVHFDANAITPTDAYGVSNIAVAAGDGIFE